MSGIPGSRVAGVGPARVDRPEWRACRQRTPEEDVAVQDAMARAIEAGGDPAVVRRTCTDPTCYCDWSPDER